MTEHEMGLKWWEHLTETELLAVFDRAAERQEDEDSALYWRTLYVRAFPEGRPRPLEEGVLIAREDRLARCR